MKQLSLFIGAFLFSLLFYDKSLGLNLLLFSILTILILYINNKDNFKNRNTLLFGLLYLVSGCSVFLYDSSLSIIANCVAFLTLIGNVSHHKSSIYVNWLNGLYTGIAGVFHRNFAMEELKQKEASKKIVDYVYWLKIIGIPLIILVVFISLYRQGNPMFDDLISKIDFSFINIKWLLFSCLGYYLFVNIHKPIHVDPATEIDLNTNNILHRTKPFSVPTLKKENQLGLILIAMLNTLIFFYLVTDLIYQTTTLDLRASTFSTQVHSGINALVASIVIAILILLYFFRGNLNFYEGNKTLMKLANLWIALNIILIISIVIKNSQYIYYFGLTYKRIGVLVYISLTLIGLLTTLIKINKVKNIWYLLRMNTKVVFLFLILSSTINWDYYMTYYNFNYAKSIDISYLINLSDNNTFLLKEEAVLKGLNQNQVYLINKKYRLYIDELKTNKWQELNFDNLKLINNE